MNQAAATAQTEARGRVKHSKMVFSNNNFAGIDTAGARAAKAGRRAEATTLDDLSHGTEARVVSVGGEGAVARRLMEMGVVPGAPVCVIKAAPLGDPIEVRVRGYHLALRRAEAQTITVVTNNTGKP